MQGVAVGCSIKTSADSTVRGGLVERSLAVKGVKEIETTRPLLKEPSSQTLTASHSEHEAIRTWSGKLPSLYFTQQENLGGPRWQTNIRPSKSSQGLSHFLPAHDSAGTQNIHHYCEVFSPVLWKSGAVSQRAVCMFVPCSPPKPSGKLVCVWADSDMPADEPAYMMLCQCSV